MGITDVFKDGGEIDFDQNPIQQAIKNEIAESTEEINTRIETLNRWSSFDDMEKLEDVPSFQRVLDLDEKFKAMYLEVLNENEKIFDDRKKDAFKVMNCRQATQEIIDVYTSFLSISDINVEYSFDFGDRQ